MIQASNLTLEEYYKLNGTLTSSMIEELLERYVNTDGYAAELIQKPLSLAASKYPDYDFLDDAIDMAEEYCYEPLYSLLCDIRNKVIKDTREGKDAIDEAIEQVWEP